MKLYDQIWAWRRVIILRPNVSFSVCMHVITIMIILLLLSNMGTIIIKQAHWKGFALAHAHKRGLIFKSCSNLFSEFAK